MGIKQLYYDNLRKLPNEYGDVSTMKWVSYWEKIKPIMNRKFYWCFSLKSIKSFFPRGVLFLSAFWYSVFQIVIVLQNINLVMHVKMDFDVTTQFLMTQLNVPQKVQLFSKNVKHRQNLNVRYRCHGYQNKILWDVPVIICCDDSIFLFYDFKDHVLLHQISLNH